MRVLRAFLPWGRCPQTPGIYRISPEWLQRGRALPAPKAIPAAGRRSSRIPALPYPPPRYVQGGRHQLRRATILQRTAITPLTSCLTPRVHFRALLSLLLACGLRRHEVAKLTIDHLQQREGHWAIVDLSGKAGHVRTVPVPGWVYSEISAWIEAAAIKSRKVVAI